MKKNGLFIACTLVTIQLSASAQAACPPLSPKGVTKCLGVESYVQVPFNPSGICTLQLVHIPVGGEATFFLGAFFASNSRECAAICKGINAEGMVDSPISCPPNGD